MNINRINTKRNTPVLDLTALYYLKFINLCFCLVKCKHHVCLWKIWLLLMIFPYLCDHCKSLLFSFLICKIWICTQWSFSMSNKEFNNHSLISKYRWWISVCWDIFIYLTNIYWAPTIYQTVPRYWEFNSEQNIDICCVELICWWGDTNKYVKDIKCQKIKTKDSMDSRAIKEQCLRRRMWRPREEGVKEGWVDVDKMGEMGSIYNNVNNIKNSW